MVVMSAHLLHLKSGQQTLETHTEKDKDDDEEADDDEHRDDDDDDELT